MAWQGPLFPVDMMLEDSQDVKGWKGKMAVGWVEHSVSLWSSTRCPYCKNAGLQFSCERALLLWLFESSTSTVCFLACGHASSVDSELQGSVYRSRHSQSSRSCRYQIMDSILEGSWTWYIITGANSNQLFYPFPSIQLLQKNEHTSWRSWDFDWLIWSDQKYT